MSAEIKCSACGAEALLLRTPVYDGFRKTGETLKCAACGHVYAREEDVPFTERKRPAVFSEADAAPKVHVFTDEEKGRFCRHCSHYLINPFTQWCARHKKEVEATDSCPDFAMKPASAG